MTADDGTRQSDRRPESGTVRAEQFRLLVESIDDYAILLLDPEGRIIAWNRGAQRIDGYTADEVLGKHISIFHTEEDRRRGHPAEELRIATEQGRYSEEGRRVRKDGSIFPAHVTITAIRAEEGQLVGFAEVTRDITERKHAEQALRESEERFRALAENATVAIFVIDEKSTIEFANRAAERIFGYAIDELVGRSLHALMPEDQRSLHDAAVARYLVTGRRNIAWEGVELPGLTKDGRVIPLEISFGEFVHEGEHYFTGIVRDITERKRAEEERERLLEREENARAAAEAAEERARFLAEASSILASGLEYEETLQRVARLAVPRLADWCIVYRSEEGGEIHRLAVAARDPATERRVLELEKRYPLAPGDPAAEVVRTGEPALYSGVPESLLESVARDEEHLRLLHDIGFRSLMLVPLRVRGRTLGAMAFGSARPGRRYGEAELEVAEELARRAAVAVDNARLYEQALEARREAERRAREEAALRRAAGAVGAAFTIEEMVHQIAQSALTATNADGAMVERIDIERNEVEVAAVAGEQTLPLGARVKYPGSMAELVIERAEPEFVPRLTEAGERFSPDLLRACPDCAALAVPLLEAGEAIGALILLRRPEKWSFRPDEVDRARTFADLASLAFRKVHLLEETERRRDELVRLMDSRARLVRGFSHDVKNPLGAADGQLQLLEEGVVDHLSEKQKESVARARNSIGSALKLIGDLTDLARAEAGKIEIERRPVDVRRVAREMADEYRAKAEAQGLTMALELPDGLPVIRSDAARIRQILGNLLSNATKYTAKGGITVRVAIREDGRAPHSGRWVAVDVADTGRGISLEQQKLLFQEFRRLETAGETIGAGIGLAISHRLARALGGDITVESKVGRGSTFTLWLPLREEESRHATAA